MAATVQVYQCFHQCKAVEPLKASFLHRAAMIELRRFQRRFLSRALAPGIRTACFSLPRGEGKSTLAGYILERCLTPGDALFVEGAEYLLGAASMEQARNTFRPIRAELEPTGAYQFLDSQMRLGITHKVTNTRLRVMSSNGKTAFGIVGVPLIVLDEPGSYEIVGGQLMNDAVTTAQGKPDSALRAVYIGTLAPARAGWWHDLIEGGSDGSTYVQALRGDPDKWDKASEIRRCNPLKWSYPESRAVLFEERDKARADSRLKARFMSYRLNVPTADESEMLLTVDDWQLVTGRPVGIPTGAPIVGVDLGGGRAWSAAVAVWQSGRVEALAVAPGIPDLEAQEERDRVPSGLYRKLADAGLLTIAQGLRVQPPAALWESILDRWGVPVRVVCDRFRLNDLQDAIQGSTIVEPRRTLWSESSADIRALRRMSRDGPLSVPEMVRALFVASLSVSMVKNDESGNVKMVKRSTNNTARDDVAAALTLAAGAFDRAGSGPVRESNYASV